MKKQSLIVLVLLFTGALNAQVWFTKTASVGFYSHTPIEDIQAVNNEAVSFINTATGEFRFQVLIKGFRFPKSAMQEHFNQPNYMDSDRFPKSEFKGTLVNPASVVWSKDGDYKVEVSGNLTMHGTTKPVRAAGVVSIRGGVPSVQSKFNVKRSEFGIEVPKFSATKVSDDIEVTVQSRYEPYTNNK